MEAGTKLNLVSTLSRDLFKHLEDSQSTFDASVAHNNKANALVSLGGKTPEEVKKVDSSLQECDHRLSKIVDDVNSTGFWLHRLKKEMNALEAPLKVCEYRLDLRSKRPPPECVSDHLQRALEDERRLLQKGREDLGQEADSCKHLLEELNAVNCKIGKHKRETMGATWAGKTGTPCAPEQKESHKLAKDLHEKARQLFVVVDTAIQRVLKDADSASGRTRAALEKHEKECTALKQRLEEGLVETEAAITAAKRPLTAAQHRQSFNQKFKASMPAPAGVETTQAMLDKLLELRSELVDDVQNKSVTLKITIQCKRCVIEKTTVPSHKTPAIQYAIGTGKYPKPIARSASTPALNRGESELRSEPTSPSLSPKAPRSQAAKMARESGSGGERPTTPVGGSATLKGAAARALESGSSGSRPTTPVGGCATLKVA